MLPKTIRLDTDSDARLLLDQFRRDCLQAGISDDQADDAVGTLREPLTTMIERGRAVAGASGQFRATRVIETNTFVVKLVAEFGVPRGLLSRLINSIRVRG